MNSMFCTFSFWFRVLMIFAAKVRPEEFSTHLCTWPKRPLKREEQTRVSFLLVQKNSRQLFQCISRVKTNAHKAARAIIYSYKSQIFLIAWTLLESAVSNLLFQYIWAVPTSLLWRLGLTLSDKLPAGSRDTVSHASQSEGKNNYRDTEVMDHWREESFRRRAEGRRFTQKGFYGEFNSLFLLETVHFVFNRFHLFCVQLEKITAALTRQGPPASWWYKSSWSGLA